MNQLQQARALLNGRLKPSLSMLRVSASYPVLTTEPGQKRCRCVDQIACAHTAREAAAFPLVVPARLTRQAGRRIASSDKRVLSAAAKTEIMGLIATIDVNAEHDMGRGMDMDTGDGGGVGGAGTGAGAGPGAGEVVVVFSA